MSKRADINQTYIDGHRAIWDTGAPATIVGQNWLESYIAYNKIYHPDIEDQFSFKSANGLHGFGANSLKKALDRVSFPIKMNDNWRILLDANIVEDIVPLLIGNSYMS